jgi:mono/diheme cytochrome c family protein
MVIQSKFGMIALSAASALIAAACQPAPAGNPPLQVDAGDRAQLEKGRMMVEAYCAGCHAIDPGSDSAHRDAPPLRVIARTYPVAALGEALAEGIMVGHPDMPSYRFDPAEIDALIAYLETIQTRQRG